jgi:hypothetical protein
MYRKGPVIGPFFISQNPEILDCPHDFRLSHQLSHNPQAPHMIMASARSALIPPLSYQI